MTQPPAARRSNPVGAPAPTGRIRRLRNGKAARHVTLAESWFLVSRHVLYYAKTFLVTKLWPAAWRNKDRTCLALIGVVYLFAYPWTLAAALCGLAGWRHFHTASRQVRLVRRAHLQLGKTVIIAPKVVAVEQHRAPRTPRGARGDSIQLGPLTLAVAPVAQALDRIVPLVHGGELVSEYWTLTIPPGINPDDYHRMRETIGAQLHVRPTFDRSHNDPSKVTMRVPRADWLARQVPWHRIDDCTPMHLPIGMDWDARWRYDSIADQAWLIAGQRGSGKTAFLRGLCGRLYDMDGVELWLADHLRDLADFQHHAHEYTDSEDGALDMLDRFVASHEKAYGKIGAGLKRLTWPDHPVCVLTLDELGAITTNPDPKIQKQVEAALYILSTQGRKTQHTLLCATQHPSAAIIPTRIRTSFTRRVGLKLGEKAESRMLFNMEDPPDCTAISEAHRGRAWFSQDGNLFQIRTPGLYDDDLSWLFPRENPPENPPGNHGRWWESADPTDQESSGVSENVPPLPPLHLVPDLSEKDLSDEDRLWLVLGQAPPTGLTVAELVPLTGIPQARLYRWLNGKPRPWVQVVQSVQPRRYRLAPGVRRSA